MRERRVRSSIPHIPTRNVRRGSLKGDKFSFPKLFALVVGILLVILLVAYLALQQKEAAQQAKANAANELMEEAKDRDHIEEASERKREAVAKEDDHLQIVNDKKKAELAKNENLAASDEFSGMSEEQLGDLEKERRKVVKDLKKAGVVMETDNLAKQSIEKLQEVTRALILKRYGNPPYRVEFDVEFPSIMPDERNGKILIELAPIELTPHVVFVFLEIVRTWTGGAFNRVAGHVLQTTVDGSHEGLAFQEYHPDFPHKQFTLGYAGRPGGPPWYISIIDNTQNHGPGSQGSATEADGCFGKVLEGFDVVEQIKKHPKTANMGFINDRDAHIKISNMKLVTREVKT